MIFIYVFYLDVFLGQNFFLNLLALSLTLLINRNGARIPRLFFAALAAAGLQAAAVVWLPYALSVFVNAFVLTPVQLLLAFGRKNPRAFFKNCVLYLLSVVVMNGSASAAKNLTGVHALQWYGMLLVFPAAYALLASGKRALFCGARQVRLTLFHKGTRVCCMGLYDSGNLLTAQGKPVHIADTALIRALAKEENGQEIPCRTLGDPQGTIRVYRIDGMKSGRRVWHNVWLGSADAALFSGKDYRVILNAAVRGMEW